VRLSGLKGTAAVGKNGSASRLVDSTASARVEFGFVSNTGAVASRAFVGASSTTQMKLKIRTKMMRRAGEQLPIVLP
jgi:hypothetical protein